jgi:RNA polymerase sigma factor (sigma-70 family)
LSLPPRTAACGRAVAACAIEQAAGGSRPAWDLLAAKLYPHIRRQARQFCRDSEFVDDLAQDAMLRAVQTLGQLQAKPALLAWSWRIVANAFRMHRRRSQFAPEHWAPFDEQEAAAAGPAAAPLDSLLAADTERRIRAAILGLPEPLRKTIELRVCLGWSTAETARALAISLPAVRTRLKRARQAIRRALA